MRFPSTIVALFVLFAGASALPTPVAQAGGVEFPTAGTKALGRGGAWATRADDPMALLHNPAALAEMQGIQLSLQSHVAFYNACSQRTGTYGAYLDGNNNDQTDKTFRYNDAFESLQTGWGPTILDAKDIPLPEVCNSGPPGIIPELVFTWRVNKWLGIGAGVVAPSAVGHTVWGDDFESNGRTYRGTVNVDGQTLPSPARYNLIEAQLIIFYPTVGIGISPSPYVNIGLSFGFGIGIFDFVNMGRPFRGEDFGLDLLNELSAKDLFIPRVSFSAQFFPHNNFEFMFGFTYTDDINAKGDLTTTTGYYATEAADQLTTTALLSAPQPWQVTLGARYAHRRGKRTNDPDAVAEGSFNDPMETEVFDIELNAVFELNKRVDAFGIEIPNNAAGNRPELMVGGGFPAPLPLPNNVTLPHNYKNQLSLRLGGDYNVVPGIFAARLGFSFETDGVTPGYEQLDFMPFMRFGAHLGATLRIAKRFDISLAYAFLFQPTRTVSEADANLNQVNADEQLAIERGEPDSAVFGTATIVNAGTYSAQFHVLSLGLTYHFR